MTKFLYATAALALLPTAGHTASVDDIIVTATRSEQPASQVGQSVTVISADTLETRQTSVLADLLSTTPGITVARNGGVGGVTSVFIRGASSEHTLVVIDGVRINDASSPGGAYDFGTLLAGNIEHIEILRGADSVPWGSAAIGGVVNITTIAPTKRLTGQLNAEGGSYDTKSLSGHLANTYGPLAVTLGGGWYNTGGISAFAKSEGGKEADGFDQHFLNGRAELKLADNISVDVRGRYARSLVNIDGFPAPNYTLADTPEYNITREFSGYAGLNASFLGSRFKNRFGFADSDIKREGFDPSQSPSLNYGYIGHVQRIEYHGDFAVVRQARLVFGAEHERSSLTTEGSNFDSAALNRTGIDSLYGQIILKPITQLTMTGGVRYDDHRTFGNRTTFSANAALRATSTTTLRASYAEGFKAPTLYQLYAPYGTGNPNLKPETATSYDTSIEQTALDGAVRATATYFNRHTSQLIDYDFSSFSYNNIRRAFAEGVELSLALSPIKTLSVSANFTHTKSINADTLARLARRPDDSVSVSIDWDAGRVKLGGTLQMVGSSYDNAANSVKLQSYALMGLRAAVPIARQLELFGRVDNLFDTQYQVAKHYGTVGRAGYIGVRAKI